MAEFIFTKEKIIAPEEKIKKRGNPDYNYEVIFEPSFQDPRIVGVIRATKK